ncbi:MAG: DUF4390 domain-containing protein [Methylococcaceae bacterium]|nr:DUF4390 domain-containing protein [Methylococcaceae bacterium]
MKTRKTLKVLKTFKVYVISVLIALFSQPLIANEFSAQIKSASLEKYKDWYELKATVDYKLSPIATEAIQSSIGLLWRLKIELKQTQTLWDKTLINSEHSYEIRYHALLNSYSVTNQSTAKSRRFTSLAAALDSMSRIRDIKVIKTNAIKKDTAYTVAIKLQFDREALPLPLRPVAYLYTDWDLSSDWYLWSLQP